jgi:hypothetical protein
MLVFMSHSHDAFAYMEKLSSTACKSTADL